MGRPIITGLKAAWVVALLAIAFGALGVPGRAAAQPGTSASEQALRGTITARYDVTLLRNGVLLTPKDRRTGHAVEITGGTVAVDGIDVSGAELRKQVGADADAIMQLTYLDVSAQRQLFGATETSAPNDRSSAERLPSREPRRPREDDRRSQAPTGPTRRLGGMVRFGRDVVIASDEVVDEDVVVIGASAKIDGEVRGDVVVIGGRADLGPGAHLHRDLTVVGGSLERDPAALIDGRINEIGTGAGMFRGRREEGSIGRGGVRRGWPFSPFRQRPFAGLVGTVLRLGALLVVASVIVFVARRPVEAIGARAMREPVKAGLVGLLIELMFVPTMAVMIVLLLVTIVGIPLLALVPVVLLAAVVVLLVGFTAVAQQAGRWAAARWAFNSGGPYRTTLVGMLLVVAPVLLARILGLAGGGIAIVTVPLAAIGFAIEYLAWTVGLGATALVRFKSSAVEPPATPVSEPLAPA